MLVFSQPLFFDLFRRGKDVDNFFSLNDVKVIDKENQFLFLHCNDIYVIIEK